MKGFIFGAEGMPKTPQELARMRAMVESLRGRRRAPQNVGEGLQALGDGLVAGVMNARANRAETAGREGANNAFQGVISALMGGGKSSSASSAGGSPGVSYSGSIPAADLETDPVNRRVNQGFAAFGGDDIGNRLMGDLMNDFGLSKDQAAGVVGNLSHESGGFKSLQELNPVVPGSRGGYGYAQWTGPRRKQFESWSKENNLDPSSYEANYGYLKHELQNTPEGSVLEGLHGAQSAGEAAELFSKGFLRPGIPHMDSRVSRANSYQTASLNPSLTPEQPAMDPKALLAQRLTKMQGGNVSANPVPEQEAPQARVAAALTGRPAQTQQPQPVQVAQAQQSFMNDPVTMQIMEALGNQYLQPGQRAILENALKLRMQAADPMQQIDLQKGQLELKNLQNPTTDDIKEYEYARDRGFRGSFPEFMTQMKKAGSNSTNVTIGEGDKFYENLDKKNAETFAMLSEGGVTARGKLNQIDRLESLLSAAPSGMEAGVKQMLGDFGINTEGLDNIQSTRALLEAMVPQQRPVGSGPMSDADVKMFRNSLPRLINQPGGNGLILQTMRGIAQYEMQMGEIADQVADRAITPAEGRKRIRELENPISAFREVMSGGSKPQAGASSTVDTSTALDRARAAIAAGAPREAVLKRLRDAGIDPGGL